MLSKKPLPALIISSTFGYKGNLVSHVNNSNKITTNDRLILRYQVIKIQSLILSGSQVRTSILFGHILRTRRIRLFFLNCKQYGFFVLYHSDQIEPALEHSSL